MKSGHGAYLRSLVLTASCLWAGHALAVDYYSQSLVGNGYQIIDINDDGDVCGRNAVDNEGFAIIDGQYLALPTTLSCRGINDAGQMVYEGFGNDGKRRAFVYDYDETSASYVATELPTVGAGGTVFPSAINNNGQVTGWASDLSNFIRAFVWDSVNGISVISFEGSASQGHDINDDGDIVGVVRIESVEHPFLYAGGQFQVLPKGDCAQATALGVNSSQAIVGECLDGDANIRPFVSIGTQFETPASPYGIGGVLRRVNDAGVAIGNAQNSAGGILDGAVWDAGNGLRLLTDLVLEGTGASVAAAYGINGSGEIGAGGFILSPVLNVPPVLENIPDQSTLEDVQLVFTASATDLDGNEFFYAASNVTPGVIDPALSSLGNAVMDEITGVFSWTPGFDQAGNYQVAVTVSDNGQPVETDMQIVNIAVGNVNRPPAVETVEAIEIAYGECLFLQLAATDPDGDIVDFYVVSGPAGVSIDDGNFLDWCPEPSETGVFEIVLDASDREDPPAVTQFSVLVTVGESERSPAELLELIIEQVDGLASTTASNKLRKKVQVVEHLLDKNKTNGAIGNLRAFQSQVQDQLDVGEISPAEAAELLALSDELIALLEGL